MLPFLLGYDTLMLMRVQQDGDIISNQVKKFYKGVQLFYISSGLCLRTFAFE